MFFFLDNARNRHYDLSMENKNTIRRFAGRYDGGTVSTMAQLLANLKPELLVLTKARFAMKCPQCKETVEVGEIIGKPFEMNDYGINSFEHFWYCAECAIVHQRNTFNRYLVNARQVLNVNHGKTDRQAIEGRIINGTTAMSMLEGGAR